MAEYERPLSRHEIRILQLLPPADTNATNAPIVCQIQVVDLDQKPKYEALSYRWGDVQDTRTIQVSDATVTVTKTLEAALQRLRLPRRARSLWIDQLCIDQENNDEKIRQVRMMDIIYRRCSQCIIWLGELGGETSDEDAAAAFELLEYIADSERLPNPEAFTSPDAFKGTMHAIQAMSIQKHPWWKRVWTLQESVLPPHKLVVWGSHTLPWRVLSQAADARINGYSQELSDHLDEYARTTEVVSLDPLGWLLLHVTWTDGTLDPDNANAILLLVLMIWREKRYATNPVDQVFGYLGLLPRKQLPHTEKCDYTTQAGHLYNATTLDLILLQGLMPLLMNPRAKSGTGTKEIARWALDLQGEVVYTIDGFYMYWGYDRYSACGGRALDKDLLLREARNSKGKFNVLGLRGHRADRVAVISPNVNVWPKWAPGPPTSSIHAVLRKWLAFAQYHILRRDPNIDHSTIEEDFGRFLLGDLVRNGEMWVERRPTPDDIATAIADFKGDSAQIDDGLWPQTSAFYSQVCNQSFFVTEGGMIGIGHGETAVGDDVWIFDGGKIPFMTRARSPTRTVDGVVEVDFVGFCYVQGLMFGSHFGERDAMEVHVY